MPKKLENNQISLSFFKNGDRLVELLTKNEVVTKRIASLIFATCFQAVIWISIKNISLRLADGLSFLFGCCVVGVIPSTSRPNQEH